MSPSVSVRLLSTQSDARLVALARQGHERAFEALVQRHRRALLSYCRRVLLPDERAEDALQQGLLQAWLALRNGAEVRDAKAWLYRIVHNAALNALRSTRYDFAELSEALSGAGAPQEDLDRRIAVREALAGLAALPELQREALMRTAVEGHSHEQVAAAMGLSEGALRGLVYRARTTLRTAVTAITPAPLIGWATAAGAGGGHGGAALAELATGGGSVGLGGLLLKGGAVAVTAGVLATGIGSVEHHRHAAHRHAHEARAAAADRAGAAPRLVSAPVGSAPSAPGSDRRGAARSHSAAPAGAPAQGVHYRAIRTRGSEHVGGEQRRAVSRRRGDDGGPSDRSGSGDTGGTSGGDGGSDGSRSGGSGSGSGDPAPRLAGGHDDGGSVSSSGSGEDGSGGGDGGGQASDTQPSGSDGGSTTTPMADASG